VTDSVTEDASDSLWTLKAFVEAVEGRVIGTPPPAILNISIDSRTASPGDAFFAIKGDVHDGHAFVGAALERNVALAVVAEDKLVELPEAGRYVVVDDVLRALERLGIAARARTKARIAAITGSVGKTSTKEALAAVLGRQGRVHYSPASFNNQWGVPLTLARMPAAVDFGVFEIGMNHAGEITPLVKMVRPHVAVVTTVAPVHLEFFESVEAIARAKGEIFSGLEPDGLALINGDITETGVLVELARASGATNIVCFGEAEDYPSHIAQLVLRPEISCARGSILGTNLTWKIGAPGRHMAINSLAVLSAAVAMGADLALAALTLGDLTAPKGRGLQHRLEVGDGEATLIDESYNANPTSMRAAIELLSQAVVGLRGRRIAVLGDMLELGETATALHAALAEPLRRAAIDKVYCAGPLMRSLWQVLPSDQRGAWAETAQELNPILIRAIGAGDAVMIKGSYGSRMGPLVEAIRAKFRVVETPADLLDS
jgi:UDP-N-acetylmuramoyl-tripeptide--D-alanyl-D-alanine ligase